MNSGGECFFLLGVFSRNNIMNYFDAKPLNRLASQKIGLKIDFYGGLGGCCLDI